MRTSQWSAALGLLAAMLGIILWSAPAASARPVTAARAFDATPPIWFQLYTVQNRYSGLCADDPHSSSSAGVDLQQYTCNGTWAQVWGFGDDSEGYKEINSGVNGNLCMEDSGSWVGTYYIENRLNDSRCLGVNNWGASSGDPLEVLDCNWGADQQWIFGTPTV